MIDLHTHSTISDGMDTPAEIIRKAHKIGLKAVAITDHDCIAGLKEAEEEAKKLNITFVKGIELTVAFGGRYIHILGLGINPEEENFKKFYLKFRERRDLLVDYILEKLNERGIYPDKKEMYELSPEGLLQRQNIVQWLYLKGYAKSISEGWVKFVDYYPYIDGELLEVEIALQMIKSAGGKSFLAHYHKPIGLEGFTLDECHERLSELKAMGLDGIERYYSNFTEANHKELDSFIEKYDFLISGGSDYHGSNRPSVQLGIGNGDLAVPDELLKSILKDDPVEIKAV